MRPSPARRLFAALASACFALSAVTWGTMPGCGSATSGATAHHAGHASGVAHQHSKLPGNSIQCLVHLCCVQLVTPAKPGLALARISAPEQAAKVVASTQIVPLRPAHVLPFAQGPPVTSV